MKITHDARGKNTHYLNIETDTRSLSVRTSDGTPAALAERIREELKEIDQRHERVAFMMKALSQMIENP